MKIKEFLKKFGKVLKEAIMSIIHGTFCEVKVDGGFKFSLGRLLLIAIFSLAMIMWVGSIEIPSTMLTVLLILLVYNLGTKALTAVEKLVQKK